VNCLKIIGKSNRVRCIAIAKTNRKIASCYISIGHKISLDTALEIVTKCCTYNIPEPIRQADLSSRYFIRKLRPS
jgi:deoxyinosine 3'endonuclease (endonuclease V)